MIEIQACIAVSPHYSNTADCTCIKPALEMMKSGLGLYSAHFINDSAIEFHRSIMKIVSYDQRHGSRRSRYMPLTFSFTGDSSLTWKGWGCIYTFEFNDIQRVDFSRLFMSVSNETGMDILGFGRKLINISGQNIVRSLLYIINDSLFNGRED